MMMTPTGNVENRRDEAYLAQSHYSGCQCMDRKQSDVGRPGAIPIPATLSIELGRVISDQQHNITYRFVSDFPFKNRARHSLDDFETNALASLRNDPNQQLTNVSSSMFNDRVRLIAPVVMGAVCVKCHNAHPESQKRDWKVGDVRGIQEIAISQAIPSNIFSFKYLLAYFILVAVVGFTFITVQRRQAATIHGMNRELETTNQFLASLSTKISRYLSPQIYKSIFSGERDVTIHTERKKLTISFSISRVLPQSPNDCKHAVAQRILYRDVQRRAQAWRHDRQIR